MRAHLLRPIALLLLTAQIAQAQTAAIGAVTGVSGSSGVALPGSSGSGSGSLMGGSGQMLGGGAQQIGGGGVGSMLQQMLQGQSGQSVITNTPGDTNGSSPRGADGRGGDASSPDQRNGIVRDVLQDNEFQRFVFQATGQKLPLFGQQYFVGTDTTFAPVDRVPVPADYVLGPGDELYVRGWGSVDIDFRATIDRNGQINIPRVGTFGVAGLKAGEIEGRLRTQVGHVFKNFNLNVTLGQLRSIQVFVVGQARRPGSYTVSSLSTLVNAVFASGGPSQNGSLRKILLRRNSKVIAELDLYDFIVNGNKDKDLRLLPGDVIVFGAAGARIAVLGSVDTPAIYELLPQGEPLDRVLAYGGGTRASTNPKTAQLESIDASQPKSPRRVTTLDLSDASRTLLKDGDIVTMFGVAPQFSNAVTLRGNVAAPLRYPFTPGMRISQLIPDRDALITPDYYIRKNKLVQFTESTDVSAQQLTRDVKNIIDEPNWEYAAVERIDPKTLAMQLIPFNLGKAVNDHDPQHDVVLQSGDVVTIFAKQDIRNPVSKQTRLVRVEGEVAAPGIYQIQAGETLPQLLQRAGGLTGDAYLFGTEFSREETRRQQQLALDDAVKRLEAQLFSDAATSAANLSATDAQAAAQLRLAQAEARKAQLNRLKGLKANGRIALELPAETGSQMKLPDVTLEDGDRVSIPSRPAFVFAVGAVSNSNAILWRDGRRMKDYLNVAGVDAEADMGNSFIVRADGTVLHASRRSWFNDLENTELMPGDTLVVPEKGNRETFWAAFTRGLKDWSQILYQFGLTAAAIKTLRN
ncbi:MAG TPA: SLBB domain-containing protein [Accumulibacter sp.]|uniref:polysaccharide biosynthesis/export family protein n=1 Tax=Accumulibacter sp. TaxID=2053492 RepID=UPI002BD8B431|nr:SLBB domain-containing protein [Accumulibacter sp.]HMW54775.1 SLBB domain-containing protein [Accumulibacter sp.]HNG77940.1 SLBB domain-containing protein [Burkholderiaceae bacterium]